MKSDRQKFLDIFDAIDFHKIIDHPNILIAARFWEDERYEAAKTCYKFMRSIDDLIDNYKAENKVIAPADRKSFSADVNDWINIIRNSSIENPLQIELSGCIEKFRIPHWPLEAFAKSMLYDINNDGFATLNDFIDYSQGASVAPASIFVDFQKDQLNNLSYFADDLILKNNLTREKLQEIAHGKKATADFRNLIRIYHSLADEYRVKTHKKIEEIRPLLEPRYQLSLEIIFSLYLVVFERIDLNNGSFTTEELNATPEETKERVYQTIINFTK